MPSVEMCKAKLAAPGWRNATPGVPHVKMQ